MEETQIRASDLERVGYQLRYDSQRRFVDIQITNQRIPNSKLDFGDDQHPHPTGGSVELVSVSLRCPLKGDQVLMAMAKVEIFSVDRNIHARPINSIQEEKILSDIVESVSKVIGARKKISRSDSEPMATGLAGDAEVMLSGAMKGEIRKNGRVFAHSFIDKHLGNLGDMDEVVFVATALKIYRETKDVRSRRAERAAARQAGAPEEEGGPAAESAGSDAGA